MADFNEFEWNIIKPKRHIFKATLRRLPVLLPILLVLIGLSYFIAFHESQVFFTDMYFFGFCIFLSIVIVGYMAFMWQVLYMKVLPPITNYQISDQGLLIDRKKFDLSGWQTIWSAVSKEELPYEEWNRPHANTDPLLELQIPTKNGDQVLYFANEHTRQKCIRAIKNYSENP